MKNHSNGNAQRPWGSWLLAVAMAPALVVAAAVQAQENPDRVRSGIQLVTATDIVAKQRGWAEHVLEVPVDWTSFDSGRSAVLGLGARGVDWTLTGSAPAAFGLSSGVEGEVVWIYHLLGANEALVVQPDSGIESVEGLAGKTVAVPFGTTTHFDMLKALELNGMGQGDLELIDMEPPDMAAAFERGDIDAGWVWFPALARLLDAGGVPILDALDMAEAGFPTADVLTVDPEFAREYPDTVARFIGVLHCGVVLGNKDMDYIVEDIMAEFGIDRETAFQALDTVRRLTAQEQLSPDWMGATGEPGAMADSLYEQASFLQEQDIIDTAFALSFYQERVNPRYIELAVERGYTEQCDRLPDWPE